MAKELDRAGIPTAYIATITSLAQSVGANRIVAGRGVTHPTGDPRLPVDEERALRRRVVGKALEALRTEVKDQLVLE